MIDSIEKALNFGSALFELSVVFGLPDYCMAEGLRLVTDKLNSKNYYAFNPSFDK